MITTIDLGLYRVREIPMPIEDGEPRYCHAIYWPYGLNDNCRNRAQHQIDNWPLQSPIETDPIFNGRLFCETHWRMIPVWDTL